MTSPSRTIMSAPAEHIAPIAPPAPEAAGGPAGCKGAGRPRAQDLAARMHSLVGCAACLFLQKGYSKVSLEMIAREAHVAVRTIYVKFGGKAGLFNAVLEASRAKFFSDMSEMETDTRPVESIVGDFGRRFLALITAPEALSMQRMVIAEASTNPELAHTFYEAGPRQTREMLARFFARPDIVAQLRDDVALELLPVHLLNCVMGDQVTRLLFGVETQSDEQRMHALEQRLALFYHSALRHP